MIADLTLLEKAALLSGADVWQTRAVPRLGIPAIWLSDGPHGVRKQPGDADHLGIGESEQAVCFPPAATVANSWDEELAEQLGAALGREASARGVHVLLGPGLNIKRSPLGGRNFEYLSEDPELAGRLAAAYVRGIQSEGVAATPKHFAANSQELRRLVSDSVVDERTLRELYLTGFEIVVREARPWALMSAYNLVNGVHAHQNHHLLTEILRAEWGFDGVVMSDWGGTEDPVAAAAAGGTLEMPSPGFDSVRAIVRAVESGALSLADLDARVEELLRLVERVTQRRSPAVAGADAHHALARRAAAAGAVLLRNEGGVLPLRPGVRVALRGPFAASPRYQGAGSSIVTPTRLTTLASLVAPEPDPEVILLALGVPDTDESEGFDRPHLRLPAEQVALVHEAAATGLPVVVVLSGGGPVEMPWLGLTAAVVHGYLGGQAGAEGIWDVLTGAVNPGGRLAETLPVALADDPTSGRFPSDGRTAEYREGLHVRYRYHASAGVAPAFPFGFGLSYTRFSYGEFSVDEAGARLTVTNTGSVAGSDVAQLYVRRVSPGVVYRPALSLQGFRKVFLAAGESRTVTMPFGERTFRFFDVRTGTWEVEQGDYEILAGPNSGDLPLRAVLTVAGTVPAGTPDPALDCYARAAVRDVPDAAFAALLGSPLPDPGWRVPPYGPDTPVDQLAHSRSPLTRGLFRILARRARTRPGLETLFAYYAPLRILHQMTSLTRAFTDAVVTVADGHSARGLARAVAAWLSGRRAERRTAAAFARASSPAPVAALRRTRRRSRWRTSARAGSSSRR